MWIRKTDVAPDQPTDPPEPEEPPCTRWETCANADLCDWLTTTMGEPEMLNDWDLCRGCTYWEEA